MPMQQRRGRLVAFTLSTWATGNHEHVIRESAPKRRASRPPDTAARKTPDGQHGARQPGPPRQQHPQPARQPGPGPAARPPGDRVQADRLQAERKKAERKARFLEIKQLIERHRLTASGAATGDATGEATGGAYHFVDGGKIKRITVDAGARAKITAGEAVILRFDGRYELLPVDIAQRVRERDERILLIKPAVTEPSASDAAYEAFPVPDDLIW
jgi:hypothetical protein